MINRRLNVIVFAVLMTGCGFFSRTQNRYFSLDTIASPTIAPVAGAPIGIDGVELPPGFDRSGIVLRGEGHRMEIRGNHLWTAPLEDMVIHTLAFDLANRLPEGMMVLPGQAKPAVAMRSLFVVFEELAAAGPEQRFILDARWTLRETGLPELARRERIEIDLRSLDSAEIALAMSQALAALADRIVTQITPAA